MRTWSKGGDFGDELWCDGEPVCEFWPRKGTLLGFIVDACNSAERRQARADAQFIRDLRYADDVWNLETGAPIKELPHTLDHHHPGEVKVTQATDPKPLSEQEQKKLYKQRRRLTVAFFPRKSQKGQEPTQTCIDKGPKKE